MNYPIFTGRVVFYDPTGLLVSQESQITQANKYFITVTCVSSLILGYRIGLVHKSKTIFVYWLCYWRNVGQTGSKARLCKYFKSLETFLTTSV